MDFWNKLMDKILDLVTAVNSNNLIMIASAIALWVIVVIFYRLVKQTHDSEAIDWTGLVTAKGTSIVSLTKVIQLVGSVVGSWVIIKVTLQEKITWDLFSIYLAYTASVEGYSKFLSAKYGGSYAIDHSKKDEKHE